MVDEYKKIEAEIQEILRKLNDESISYKGSDIYKFILKMQKDFKLNTGIDLIPEINIIVNRSGKFNS